MSIRGKRYRQASESLSQGEFYAIDDALKLVKQSASAKFDETVDVSINLGVDAKKSDQSVRGATVLPKGTGKTVCVAVFADGDDVDAAKSAGADIVGLDDLAETIKGGSIDFDVCIATPSTMRVVGKTGPDPGPPRPHAEPQSGNRCAGRGEGRDKCQGRASPVSYRQGGCDSLPNRKSIF